MILIFSTPPCQFLNPNLPPFICLLSLLWSRTKSLLSHFPKKPSGFFSFLHRLYYNWVNQTRPRKKVLKEADIEGHKGFIVTVETEVDDNVTVRIVLGREEQIDKLRHLGDEVKDEGN